MREIITLTAGSVEPAREGGVVVARNLPYAAASRFEAPRPHPGWTGLRDGRQRGPVCVQLASRLERVTGQVVAGLAQSEACQVLSVATPDGAESSALPVLVWFHGGAYLSGGGEAPKYDPARLAAEGQMVVVTVTSRLGLLGYLPPSSADAQNLGLEDQVEALRWVHREIGSFGGDPTRVTVAGQSAGADSIYCMLLMHAAEPLFHRAILSSAPLGLRTGRQVMTEALQTIVDGALGDGIAADSGRLLAVQAQVAQAAGEFGLVGGLPMAPMLGVGGLPSEEDVDSALSAAAPHVDLLVGHMRDDAAAFVVPDSGQSLEDPAMAEIVRAVTEEVFAKPSRQLADTWRAAGGAASTFVFDQASAVAPFGACHCIELPHVFGTDWTDAPMLGSAPNGPVSRSEIRRAWIDFVHAGVGNLRSDLTFTS
jgi:para-nitrobenzyl esterase